MKTPVTVALLLLAAPVLAEDAPTVEAERAAIRLADPGLTLEPVASEPAVAAPVAAAWDEFGRMYVVEMTDYPLSPDGGRVKRLEDRDGDGSYEHVTVFADGLHWPSGVLPWNGGVLVTAAPDLVFFKDEDGDGRAEVRKVLLTGFGEGNQQLRVNTPTWGMDNHVYLANGRSGGNVRRPDEPPSRAVAIPRNDLRVDPATGAFRPVAGFSQFGLPRDDWGDRFPSWNTVPVRHVVLEGDASASGVADILDLSDGGRIYSLAPAQRRFNAETVAFFNATCGPTVYRGDLLGEAYAGHVFVCEPLTSVVHHRRLDPNGPTYTARRVEAEKDREFLASTHPWFRPVNLTTGPDGALYVLDFCRAWVEHPAFVPEKQRNSVDFREGFEHGRIWRVVPKGLKDRPKPCRPGTLDTARLVALLVHPNGWCRDTAQRLLVERKDAKAAAPLRALAEGSKDPRARAHALWTLLGLGAADAAVVKSRLADPHPHVREAAVRVASAGGLSASLGASVLAGLADDPDARVRLRAAEALGSLGGDDAIAALGRIAARDADSTWASAAVMAGVGPEPGKFLGLLTRSQPGWLADPSPAQAAFLARLAAKIRGPERLDAIRTATAARGGPAAFALLQGLAEGQNIKSDLDAMPESLRGEVAAVLTRAEKAATDHPAPTWVRLRALAVLLATRDPAAKAVLPALLAADQPAEVQAAAALGLGRLGDVGLVDDLLSHWDGLAVSTRRILLDVLCESPALAERLVAAVETKSVSANELDPATRLALRRTGNPALKRRVAEALGPEPGADRRAVVGLYENALNLSADPARGRTVFEKQCKTCHSRGGQGAKVGPELLSVAGKAPADLLVAILDPSREAAPDGVAVLVATTRGETLTGLLVEENPTGLRLRRAEGVEELVPRAEVEAVRSTGRSLMPDGLEQVLSPQDVADLIAFLRSP